MLKAFIKNTKGATAFEYSLLAALIGVVIIASLSAFGNKLSSAFNNITSKNPV